jgi:hypothetical protein
LVLTLCTQPARQLCPDIGEGDGQKFLAPDDHIVVAGLHVTCSKNAHGLLQPPANAVAHDGVADLFGDREADARRGIVATVENFNEKQPPAALFTTPDGQKFRPLAKPRWRGLQGLAGCRQSGRLRSGGKPLTAAVAAGGNDTATTLGGHAGTEAVPTLADEFGRLIGTLHFF